MARRFGDVKFCEIGADLCIEGYPERNTPTILVYHDGDIRKQIVTLRELGGEKTSVRGTLVPKIQFQLLTAASTKLFFPDLQRLFINVGAVKASDHRVLRSDKVEGDNIRSSIRDGHTKVPEDGDDDDDWD